MNNGTEAIKQSRYMHFVNSDVIIPPERINYADIIGYTAPYLKSILSATALEQYELISQYLSRKWEEEDPLIYSSIPTTLMQ